MNRFSVWLREGGACCLLGQSLSSFWRCGLLCSIGVIVAAVGWINIRPEDFPAAHLQPSRESLSLGQVWIQSDLLVPMVVLNNSSRRIQIEGFELSHPSVSVVPATELVIAAGAALSYEIHIDLVNLVASGGPLMPELQPFEVRIRPVTNWGRVPLPWRVHGIAHAVANGLPSAVKTAPPLIGGRIAPSQEFRILLHELVGQLSAESSSPDIQVVVQRPPGEANDDTRHRVVQVIPQPGLTLKPGTFCHVLQFVASSHDGFRLAKINIPIFGAVEPDMIPLKSF